MAHPPHRRQAAEAERVELEATAQVAEEREVPRGIGVVGVHGGLRQRESAVEEGRARGAVVLLRCGVAQRKRLECAERAREAVCPR